MFLIASSGIIGGCVVETREKLKKEATDSAWDNKITNIRIMRLGDCEYLKSSTSYDYPVFAHKGDCDNPIHIYKEIK